MGECSKISTIALRSRFLLAFMVWTLLEEPA